MVALDRREAAKVLLRERGDALVVTGLGSTTYDAAAAGDDDRTFYLWGAMGGAAMIGLGLALAQPKRRVLVLTGDGEMLMGMGSLATVARQRPDNLAIVVFDNGLYAETGMQESHTAGATDLVKIAAGCGFALTFDVKDEAGLKRVAGQIYTAKEPLFARVAIAREESPRVLPLRDGPAIKNRFRAALGLPPL